MTAWVIAIAFVYGLAALFLCSRFWYYSRTSMQRMHWAGVREGIELARERVLSTITQQTWIYRRENKGLFAYCMLVSDAGIIPLRGPLDFEEGEIVLIGRRLPFSAPCPFYLCGYEKDLSIQTSGLPSAKPVEYDDS